MQESFYPFEPEALLQHASFLRSLAVGILRDADQAQDAVQQAWLTAIESPPRHQEAVKSWLGTVVRRLAIRSQVRERSRVKREQAVSRPEAIPASEHDDERQRLLESVVRAVGDLEGPCHQVILLRYFENLPPREIAKRLEIPVETVHSRVRTALGRLRKRLDGDYRGDRRAWSALMISFLDARPSSVVAKPASSLPLLFGTTGLLLVVGSVWFLWRPSESRAERSDAETASIPSTSQSNTEEKRRVEGIGETLAETGSRTVPELNDIHQVPTAVTASGETVPLRGGKIRGRVVDEKGVPIPGVEIVDVNFYSTKKALRSDAQGRFEFQDWLIVDSEIPFSRISKSLSFRKSGRGSRTRDFTMEPDATIEVGDIVLGPGIQIIGKVLGTDGKGVPDAWVASSLSPFQKRTLILTGEGKLHGEDACSPNARSDANGDFVLYDCPEGRQQIWVAKKDFEMVEAQFVLADLGPPLDPVVLTLKPVEAYATFPLDLLVRGPQADRFEGSLMVTLKDPGSGEVLYYANREPEGRFSVAIPRSKAEEIFDLEVMDIEGRYPRAQAKGIRLSDSPIQVQFREHPLARMVVVDESGNPVENFEAWLLDRGYDNSRVRLKMGSSKRLVGFFSQDPVVSGVSPKGIAEIPLKGDGWSRIVVRATDGRAGETPLLHRDTLPSPLSVVLHPFPSIQVEIRAKEGKIQGATVQLFEESPKHRTVVMGFLSHHATDPLQEALSDDSGKALIRIPGKGRFFLRAQAANLAPREIGPMELSGDEQIAIDMSPGGALAGKVLVAPGRGVEGIIVGVSCGDGYPRTTLADANGEFHFDGLSPGRYQILQCEELNPSGFYGVELDPAFSEPEGVLVEEGKTARRDLNLRGVGATRLHGKLEVLGILPTPLIVELIPARFLGEEIWGKYPSVQISASRPFEIAVDEPGDYWLRIRPDRSEENSPRFLFSARVRLQAGVNEWNLKLSAGKLRIVGLPPMREGVRREYFWEDAQGSRFHAWIHADAKGECIVPLVPAGRGQLKLFTLNLAQPGFDWKEEIEAEVDVREGDATEIRLP